MTAMDDDQGRTSPRAEIGPGTTLNNTYMIDSLIGSGGMGDIYRGHAIHTGDAVAIKVIRTDLEANDAALALFRREASALNHLYHEAIVRYYGFSYDPVVKRHYLAMEFVDGPSLSEHLRQGPLPFEVARDLQQRVATGLQAAHERGIIHRDVSPDNIIVPSGDVARAKIIDFGISRSTELDRGTIVGSGFAGKYNYVSPEQLGLAGGDVTAKSDIYSLGLVIAEALSGRPIDMGGTQAEVVEKRRSVPDLSMIDRRIRPLVAMMLQPNPGERPPNMAAVAAWQDRATQPAVESARGLASAGPPKVSTPISGKRAQRWIIGGALAASGLAIAMVVAYNMLLEPQLAPPSKPLLTTTQPSVPPSTAALPGSTSSAPPASPPPAASPAPLASSPPSPSSAAAIPGQSPAPPPAGPDIVSPNPPPQPPAQAPGSVNTPVALPAPPATVPDTQPVDPIVRIMRYVNRYDGGDCFFVAPVRVAKDSAGVAGFAKTSDRFDDFDRAFSREIGFSPDITGQIVWASQCAAVNFLHRVRAEGEAGPILDLKSISVRNGQSLVGEIRGYGNQTVDLLQVQDDGLVRNVTDRLREDGDAKVFDIPVSREGTGGPFPQMLLVVVSPQSLSTLKTDRPIPGDQFFPAVLSEAAAKGYKLGAAARLFLLRG
jgi:eukaryotic-like serine/threonine-protein kinase